jgi:aminopeptidase N
LTKLVERDSWADVTRAGALEGLAELRDDDALPVLTKYTAYGTPTRGRQAAILSLSRLSQSRRTRELLEDLLDDGDPHLRIDVVAALESLGDVAARDVLRKRLDRELDGRVKRRNREALRNLGATFERERRSLKVDLETFRRELGELKLRLAKLEKHPEPEPSAPKPSASAPKAARPKAARKKPKKTPTTKTRAKEPRTKKSPAKQAAHGRRARSR